MTRRLRDRRLHSLRVALACAAFVVAWFADGWHLATAHHQVCPEHGELVDVGAERALADPGHADHAPGLTRTGDGAGVLHDHCAFVALSQPTLTGDPAPIAVLDFGVRRAAAPPARASVARDERRFLLAPKQSPPIRVSSRA